MTLCLLSCRFRAMSVALLVAIFGSIGLVVASPAWAVQQVTLYGDNDYAPYSFDNNGNPDGLYVHVLQEAGRRIAADYNIIIKLVPWKRGLKSVETGEVLALFPPYFRPSVRPYISVYSEPLYEESVVTFCTPEVASKVAGQPFPEGYAGMVFGSNLGFNIAGEAFQKMRDAGTVRVEDANGTEVNIRKLLGARLECYVNDRLAVLHAIRAAGGTGSEVVETAVVNSEKAFVGYSAPAIAATPWANDFIEKLNAALVSMKADGTLNRLMAK